MAAVPLPSGAGKHTTSQGATAAPGRQSHGRRVRHPRDASPQRNRSIGGQAGSRRSGSAVHLRHRPAGWHAGAGHQALCALRRCPAGCAQRHGCGRADTDRGAVDGKRVAAGPPRSAAPRRGGAPHAREPRHAALGRREPRAHGRRAARRPRRARRGAHGRGRARAVRRPHAGHAAVRGADPHAAARRARGPPRGSHRRAGSCPADAARRSARPRRPCAHAVPAHRPRNIRRWCGCPAGGRCGSHGRRSRRGWR